MRHPSGASPPAPDSPLSISGSGRLQVEMWIADYIFSFPLSNMWSIGVSVQRIARLEEKGGRSICTDPRRRRKKLTLSLSQPDKVPTERNRMDVIPPPLFSPIPISLSFSFSFSHTNTQIFCPLISVNPHPATTLHPYLFPSLPPILTPPSSPLWFSGGCWELADITAGLETAYKLWVTSLWTNKSTTIFHAQ